MDWASSEWKQNLTPLAVQKVNALEEKVQRLQKERDQKQIRLDWLNVELEKEQRKVEKKNQDTLNAQKELQSVENVCKDLESKHQKLMAELQNRDSRIGSLEGLLSKAKQDNCK
ncbi:tropomyosin Por p 1.0101-like, partial [Parasteatoda tepidariorum]|uniref:tropomyosin Por p 1.0101-like n=1 Tax=Parasteatoda tepidariorum TaxID=114398 RepID=UPI001C729C66